MALEINLLKSKAFRKSDELTQVHGSIKWCVVFADGSHKYLYKIITGSSTQFCGSGGGYAQTCEYIYLAWNWQTLKYEPVKHLQHALSAFEAEYGAAIWAQSQTVGQTMMDKWGQK
jgi:hypothetical protein